MQNLIKTVALIFFINFSYSQTIKNLDNKFGFKTISFNSKISQYEFLTKINANSKEDLYQYNSKDSDLKKVFEEEFTDLFLSFSSKTTELEIIWLKQKIHSISQNCFAIGLDKVQYLKNEYEKIIGKPTKIFDTKEGFGYIWQGNKVKLTIILSPIDSKINDNDQIETNCVIYVTFEKSDISTQKSGF